MKNIMISTAIVAAMALPAMAQDSAFVGAASPGAVHASDLIGARVYASEGAIDASEYNGVQADWSDIGEINDLILNRDGMIDAVLVDIGGFLGMGERQTAVDMSSLRFVSDAGTADNPDDWFLVLTANRATIEGAPEWKMPSTGLMDDTKVPATDMATDATRPMQTVREGYTNVEYKDLTSELLTGATAYDSEDKNVGEISDLVLTADGQITAAIIDVGGFLGMGAKPVEVKLDQLNILRQNDGTEVRVYVALTKEQMEAMPHYTN